jgi:hypothetical protein
MISRHIGAVNDRKKRNHSVTIDLQGDDRYGMVTIIKSSN